MTFTSHQWTLAFVAALALHAPPVVLLPQGLFSRRSDPPPPQPVLIVLAAAPAPPTPVVTPPQPPRPTPPVVRQPEPRVPAPTPKAVTPQPAPATVNQGLSTQQSVAAAVNPTPVAAPQASPIPEAPVETTTAAAPTLVSNTANLDRLMSQHGETVHKCLDKHKHYPRRAEYRGDEGKVELKIDLKPNGEVAYRLGRSSGNPLLDKGAKETFRRSQSCLEPPAALAEALAEVGETKTLSTSINFESR